MTSKELYRVKEVLLRIRSDDPRIKEAIAYIDKDIALREQQSKIGRDSREDSYDYRF